jgi:hypothetical protein
MSRQATMAANIQCDNCREAIEPLVGASHAQPQSLDDEKKDPLEKAAKAAGYIHARVLGNANPGYHVCPSCRVEIILQMCGYNLGGRGDIPFAAFKALATDVGYDPDKFFGVGKIVERYIATERLKGDKP